METTRTSPALLGFWIYLMSDCLIFASLFATYAVLSNGTFGGPGPRALFDLSYVLIETLLLLTSSFTAGLMTLAAGQGSRRGVLAWLLVTLALGLAFVGLEAREFAALAASGAGPGQSAFLSGYFTLVGTHGLHVALGALWMLVMLVHVARTGLSEANQGRLAMLALFWHFLDIIWIAIFTIVYLYPFI